MTERNGAGEGKNITISHHEGHVKNGKVNMMVNVCVCELVLFVDSVAFSVSEVDW